MHGIRLDSDVEDTPDKRERPQIQNTGGQTFRTNRGSTENHTEQEKTISPGKQLPAVKAVRRSRLRLASKGSASAQAALPGVTHHPPGAAAPCLRLTAKEDEASSPQLPNRAQQDLAVTPQRPRSFPEWSQRMSAKPKAARASPPRAPYTDTECPLRASGPQTESLVQHQRYKDAPPPSAQAAHADDVPAAADGSLGGGGGAAAAAAAAAAPKKSVQAKLSFFAPQVRRVSKPAVLKVDSDPGIHIPSAAQPAVPPDSVHYSVNPSNPPQQQQQEEEDMKVEEGDMKVEEDKEKEQSESVFQPQEPPVVVALVSEAPSSHDAAQGATAPQNEVGPAPEQVPVTEYVSLLFTEAGNTSTEHMAVGGAHSTAKGTADGAPCAEAAAGDGAGSDGAANACGLTEDTIGQQQQQQQPPHPYSDFDGFGAWQDHATATVARRHASRTCRQALLPGALPPSAVAAAGKAPAAPASPVAATAAPTVVVDATAGPQACDALLPVKGRRRGSQAGEAGLAGTMGGGTGGGRGAAGRARRQGRGGCGDAAAPEPTAVLSDGTASSADGGDVDAAGGEEYHPTGRRPTQGLLAAGSVRGRGRGRRGGARG
ncbi:hypothetical protein Vafri_9106, partial [Volvox africanus]